MKTFSLLCNMAWKNIKRNKRRTVLSGGALFLVSFVICFWMAMEYGSMDDMKFNIVHHQFGTIRVRNPEYTKNERINPLSLNIEDTSSVIEQLLQVEGVTQVEPVISSGIAVYKDGETTISPVLGINLQTHYLLRDKDNQLVAGNFEDLYLNPKKVIVTDRFAKNKGLDAGDKFTFMVRTANNGTNASTVTIGAIVHLSNGDYSGDYIFMDFLELSRILRMNGNASELQVFTEDWENNSLTEAVLSRLQANDDLKGLEMTPWLKGTAFASMIQFADLIYFVCALIFFMLASTVIFNSTMMSVMERKKEIGSLLSLGMTPRSVQLLFLLETIFVSAIAAILGTLLGALVVNITGTHGINLANSAYEVMEGFSLKMMLYPHLSLGKYFEFGFTGFAVAVIACIIPSRMALKVEPSEALRNEN